MTIGVYIHIPFCKKACHYCNFHFSTQLSNIDEMMDSICNEIVIRKDEFSGNTIQTIYFGGGTPSILEDKHYKQLFDTLRSFDQEIYEITLEANPEDISEDKLRIIKYQGITRFSIGIQSFIERDLQLMNRSHNVEQAHKSLKLIKEYGFDSSTLDLIYGLPESTEKEWEFNIDTALSYGFPHLSTYNLTVESGTALAYMVSKGKVHIPPDETSVRQYDIIMDKMEHEGYEHYEISNFALPGFRALHNTNYWNDIPYIGIGPGAHSYLKPLRSWNIAHNIKYMKSIAAGIRPYESEILSDTDLYNEWLMTGLRRKEGVYQEEIKKMGPEYVRHYHDSILALSDPEWIHYHEGHLRLTRRGKHFADRVTMELMYEE